MDDFDVKSPGEFLHRYGKNAMALTDADPAEIWIARLTDPGAMAAVAPDEPEAWRHLDVAILHKLIIDQALEPYRTDQVIVEYTPDARRVLAACRSRQASLGVCLQPTQLSEVQDVALAGTSMPHKSTYFYPKLATGMVLKPLS